VSGVSGTWREEYAGESVATANGGVRRNTTSRFAAGEFPCTDRRWCKRQGHELTPPVYYYAVNYTVPTQLECTGAGLLHTTWLQSLIRSCFHNIRDLRHIRNTIDQASVGTVVTFLIPSNIDYCNFFLLNLPWRVTHIYKLWSYVNSKVVIIKLAIWITHLKWFYWHKLATTNEEKVTF